MRVLSRAWARLHSLFPSFWSRSASALAAYGQFCLPHHAPPHRPDCGAAGTFELGAAAPDFNEMAALNSVRAGSELNSGTRPD